MKLGNKDYNIVLVIAIFALGWIIGDRFDTDEPTVDESVFVAPSVTATPRGVSRDAALDDMRYTYVGQVYNVVDGDTVDIEVELGFNLFLKERFRLYGINTPEMRGPNKLQGQKAKEFVEGLLLSQTVILKTMQDKPGKYGRILGTIWPPRGEQSINEILIELGLAKPYPANLSNPLFSQ